MNDRLTRREIQCVRLAGEGLTNKEIARRLGSATAYKTVSNHLSNAYAKLGTSDRFKAAEIVATTYPDLSRLGPIPIATTQIRPAERSPPDDEFGDQTSPTAKFSWPLPAPNRRVTARLLIVVGFAAVVALLVIGIVAVMWASVSLTKPMTPPNLVRSEQQPTGTTSMTTFKTGARIARQLQTTEKAVDSAMVATSALIQAMIEGRGEASLAAEVGQTELTDMVAGLQRLNEARGLVVRTHSGLAVIAELGGVGWRLDGPYEHKLTPQAIAV